MQNVNKPKWADDYISIVAENEGGKSLEEIAKKKEKPGDSEDIKEWWLKNSSNIIVRKPVFSSKRRKREGQDEESMKKQIEADAVRDIDRLKKTAREDAISFMIKVGQASKCLPSIDGVFFISAAKEIISNIEGVLKDEAGLLSIAEMKDSFREIMLKPRYLFTLLENKFIKEVNDKSLKYFEPLINMARSDVKRFLIKHFNTIKMPLEQASEVIVKKQAIEAPIRFGFRKNVFSFSGKTDNTGVLGSTDMESIDIFFDDISYLKNGKLDEAELLATLVHEIVHTVSVVNEGGIGLKSEKLFDKDNPEGMNSPETNLNEMVTEVVAMGIMSKYFKKKTFIDLKKTEKQEITGYEDLVREFNGLIVNHPVKSKEFLTLATDAMLRGDFSQIRIFFRENQDIFLELNDIVERQNNDFDDESKISSD